MRFASALVTLGLLAVAIGCSQQGAEPPLALQGTMSMPARWSQPAQSPSSVGYSTVYNFDFKNGAEPYGTLTNVGGLLYGTTEYGGDTACNENGCGTVFSMTTSGGHRILHQFTGDYGDGRSPLGGLLNVNGTLYGTTPIGGREARGTLFSIDAKGNENVLYSFDGFFGATPNPNLVLLGGKMYGTAFEGGGFGNGSVFVVSSQGFVSALYDFKGGRDGAHPYGGLVVKNGVLYGTTLYGGNPKNFGTAFSITTSGVETVLHRFKGGKDGEAPYTGLVAWRGALYGTTLAGGSASLGTIFSVTPSGTGYVVYSFKGGADGAYPETDLSVFKGALYGTTGGGGMASVGTVFKFNAAGKERVLHQFMNSPDGASPHGALVDVGGTLYGTTTSGGTGNLGTVFSVTLPGPAI